jgi:hypothetical protein
MLRHLRTIDHRVVLALFACAMLLRALVPAGWMPVTGADGMIRISMCTGLGAQTMWIDRDGQIHKDAPVSESHDPQPCGFNVLGLGLDIAPVLALSSPIFNPEIIARRAKQTLAIGHGLAAPPPPSTGPPNLI